MRTNTRFLWLLLLATLCFCLTMTACVGGDGSGTDSAETAAPTEPVTAAPAEEATAAATEAATAPSTDEVTVTSTEEITEAPTDAVTAEATEEATAEATGDATGEVTAEATEEADDETTEAPTDPLPEPTLMTVIDLDGVEDVDASDYFSRLTKCSVTLVDDETEGKVVRMATKGISTAGTVKPYAFFKIGELVTAMNGIMPNTTEYPHLVMKVRSNELWSHTLYYFGGETLVDAGKYEGYTRSARMAREEGWQYIYLDLTAITKNWQVFFINFENMAGKTGESLDIAELHFFATPEEAEALCPNAFHNTYPIVEQTMDDYTLKVMSFNIQTENGTQVNFDLRAELFRDLLDELQPDSIGMQEVTTGWIRRMDSFSFNNSYAGVGEGRTPGGEASSIYYRKDKFDLVDSGTFWLSETPDVAGSYLEASLYPRICTWVHLRDKATGFEYIHVNTHLDHLGGSDGRTLRTAQVRVILEYLQTLPDVPMVMTGDFNQAKTNSSDEIYAMYKNVLGQSKFTATTGEKITGNFSDARADAPDTVSPDAWASMTSSWQEGDSYNPAKKPIDYVFYTTGDFDAMVYRNIHYHRDGIYMSDHLPQYCELHVKVPAEQSAA